MEVGHILVDAVEERCILVGIITQKLTEETANEYIDELRFFG
jgi:GTPase